MILLIAFTLNTGAFAQHNMDNMGKKEHKLDMKKDHVMMMGGSIKMVKNGYEMPMDKDMTMGNGTKVMTDGMCIKKDGTKMTMKNGDMMDMDGKMSKMSNKSKKAKKSKMKM